MSFDILIPEITNAPKNTKDAIISILTTEWPLSLRSIFYKIKKIYRYSHSYQSVYKAVKELCGKNVLNEKNKQYEINVEWIKNLQSFTDIVETNYYAKKRLQDLSGLKESKLADDLMILNFETLFDAEKYLYYFMKTELFKKREDAVCFQLNNEWRPIFYLRAEYNYYRRLMKRGHKFYFLCHGNSYLERLSKDFYKSIGINFKTTNQEFHNDAIVFSDFFVQVFIPEELREKMKGLLDKNDIMGLLKDVLEKKSSIRVIINRDLSLANQIKNQVTSRF